MGPRWKNLGRDRLSLDATVLYHAQTPDVAGHTAEFLLKTSPERQIHLKEVFPLISSLMSNVSTETISSLFSEVTGQT